MPARSCSIQRHSTGSARATRRTAVALGPISLSRTSTGENPRPRMPADRAAREPCVDDQRVKGGEGCDLDGELYFELDGGVLRLRLPDGAGVGAIRFVRPVLAEFGGISRHDLAAARQHLEEAAVATDQRNHLVSPGEDPPHAGRLL